MKQSSEGRQNTTEHLYYLVFLKTAWSFFILGSVLSLSPIMSQQYTQVPISSTQPTRTSKLLQLVSRKIINWVYKLAHKNHLEKFLKYGFPGLTHRDSDLLYKKKCPGIRSSHNSKAQSDLGTSGMEYGSINQPASHRLVLIWLKGHLMEGNTESKEQLQRHLGH